MFITVDYFTTDELCELCVNFAFLCVKLFFNRQKTQRKKRKVHKAKRIKKITCAFTQKNCDVILIGNNFNAFYTLNCS
jgi:hypothetical protein